MLAFEEAGGTGSWAVDRHTPRHELSVRRRDAAYRCKLEGAVLVDPQFAKAGLAQPHGLFQHHVEYRREITGRRVDDTQHFSGRGLLFERLSCLGDKARVLDRYDRLIGEG